jgi:hypothetical protein
MPTVGTYLEIRRLNCSSRACGRAAGGWLQRGRNIRLEIEARAASRAAFPELAAELVRLSVDAIVAYQTPSATAVEAGDQRYSHRDGGGIRLAPALSQVSPGRAAMSQERPRAP